MSPAWAAQPPVGLGTATSFAVLAGTTVTNTGPSVISGDLGVSPGKAIVGFPPGHVINGVQHKGDAIALQAKNALTTGYNDAAGRTPATVAPSDLGGKTLSPGVYKASSALGLTGTVTLDAKSDPNAVFVFQAVSTLITAPNSTVKLIGGAQACNVFWQVGSSATLGTGSTFVGTIMALTDATVRDQGYCRRTGVGSKRPSQSGRQHHHPTDLQLGKRDACRHDEAQRAAVPRPVFRRARAAKPAPSVSAPSRLQSSPVSVVSHCSCSACTERADDAVGGTEPSGAWRFRSLSNEVSEPPSDVQRRPRSSAWRWYSAARMSWWAVSQHPATSVPGIKASRWLPRLRPIQLRGPRPLPTSQLRGRLPQRPSQRCR